MKKALLMLLGVLIALPMLARDFTNKYEGQNLTARRSISSTGTDKANYAEEAKSTDYVAYFDNGNSNWDEVYVYTWTGGTKHTGTWPGTRLTETIVVNGKTYFVAHVPVADSETMIIFNNGEGQQTADLHFEPGSWYNLFGLKGILTFFNFTYEFEGQTLTYSVTSEEDKTVMIKHNNVSGTLIIPEIAKDGDVEYTVTTIGESAFEGCGNLKQVIIPGSVTKISETAFQNCEGLCRVVFPSTIGFDPYENIESLSTIWEYNPENVNPIEDIIKYGCFYDSEEKKVLMFVSLFYTGVFNIPDTVERISSYAFYGCTGLTSVTIPEGVTSIGESAFAGCTGLKSVTIPESVTSIGVGAFEGCTGLTSVTIPESVTSIVWDTFKGCTGLTSVTIPESVTSIGAGAFEGCTGLTSIVIPPAVRSIGKEAFYGCTGLKKMACNDLVVNDLSYAIDDDNFVFVQYDAQDSRMEDGVIYSRRKTKIYYVPLDFTGSFTIPETVETIGEKAFACCSGLTTVKIPDSVREIEFGAFASCENLASIIIPNNVESIGIAAFQQCSNLKTVNIPTSLTSIDDYVFSSSGLTSVKIPDSVTSIGECAFAACENLTSVKISDSVTSLGGYAFELCENLTFVKLSGALTSIGEEAFVGCYSLSNIEYPATTPVNADSNIFESDVYDNATLYVPQGATKNYDSVNPWKLFYNIEEKDFASVITPAEPVVKVGDKVLETGSSFESIGDVEVAMTCETEGAQIYYLLTSVDASDPTAETNYTLYTEPVKVAATSRLSVYAELNGEKSDVNTYVITIKVDGVAGIAGEEETPEYYTLQGIRVANPEAGQIYIVRQCGRTYKVIMQ